LENVFKTAGHLNKGGGYPGRAALWTGLAALTAPDNCQPVVF